MRPIEIAAPLVISLGPVNLRFPVRDMFPGGKKRIPRTGLRYRFSGLRICLIHQWIHRIAVFVTAVFTDIVAVTAFGVGCLITVRLELIMVFKLVVLKHRFRLRFFVSFCCKCPCREKRNHHAQAKQQRNHHSFLHNYDSFIM